MYKNDTVKTKLHDNTTDCQSINQGVRRGCPGSPTYLTYSWIKRLVIGIICIKMEINENFNELIFADDQVFLSYLEGESQRGLYTLHNK